MSDKDLLSERRGQSLILTFNRPEKANAMTLDMVSQLFNILKNTTTDRGTRAVLICGAGSNFMDGIDMSIYGTDIAGAQEKINNLLLPYHSAIRELQAMEKPVIAAVEGRVSAAGLSLMLACDFVIAAKNTVFNSKFTHSGMTPDGGCSYFLPRKIGIQKAIEILTLAEDFDVDEAEKLRLVNRVVETEHLQEEAIKLLDRLAEGPTRAYGAVKRLVMKAFEQDMNTHLGLEHTYFGQSMRSFDFRDAVKARATGKPVRFSGT